MFCLLNAMYCILGPQRLSSGEPQPPSVGPVCSAVEVAMVSTSVGGGGAGVQENPLKFWFVESPGKIYENVCKIPENLAKLSENMARIGTQCCLILIKLRPTWDMGRITNVKNFFWRSSQTWCVWEEILRQRVAWKLFGQVWGNSGKNLSHPKKSNVRVY